MAVTVADTPRPAGTRVRRRLRTADRAHRRRERARGFRMRPSLLPATGPFRYVTGDGGPVVFGFDVFC